MTLKTLEDLNHNQFCPNCQENPKIVRVDELKKEAIKWVKEDINFILNSNSKYVTPHAIAEKWMFRFDITEEDLKNE